MEGLEDDCGSDSNSTVRSATWNSRGISERAGHNGGEQSPKFLVFPDDHQFPEMLWVSTVTL